LRFNYRSQMSQITVTHPTVALHKAALGHELQDPDTTAFRAAGASPRDGGGRSRA
jgi:hypothetical protein